MKDGSGFRGPIKEKMKIVLATLAALMGYFLVLLLPFVFLIWFVAYLQPPADPLESCFDYMAMKYGTIEGESERVKMWIWN